MKIVVVHGDTQIQISGKQSMKKMKRAVKDILSSLPHEGVVEEDASSNPIGFVGHAQVEVADMEAAEVEGGCWGE